MIDALTVAAVALVLMLAFSARRLGQVHRRRWLGATLAARGAQRPPRRQPLTPTEISSYATPHAGGLYS